MIGWFGLLVLALAWMAPAAPAAARTAEADRAADTLARNLRGQYIVTLKPDARPAAFLKTEGIAARFVYDKALNGFAARLSVGQLAALLRHPAVARVEPDQAVSLVGGGGAGALAAPWHLDRIDQRYLPLSGTASFGHTGSTANIYIIDTGIETSHPDFGGRAAVAYDALGGTGQDCNGNGTFVAGLAGGAVYGVAKGARLWSVRVLDCSGSAALATVIAGLNWVAANHKPNAVATLTLGGSSSASLNSAVNSMINAGVFTAVVAGNSNANACNFSPAGVTNAITAAASDITDKRASFTNYGSCIDLYAPGVNITSDGLNGGTRTGNGSATAPLVAGVAALYKSVYGDQPSTTVNSWIISQATPNVIINNPAGTPNRLLYSGGL
jgi:subtilisin family serine protease